MNEAINFSPICIACTYTASDKPEDNIEMQFERKMKECAHQIRDGMKIPKVFKSLTGNVIQAALSQTHLSLLFEDKTVCRIGYTIDDSIDKQDDQTVAEGVRPPSVKRSNRIIPGRSQQPSTSRTNALRANLDRLAFSAAISGSGQSSDLLPQIAAANGATYSIRSRLVRSAGRSRQGTAVLIGTSGTPNSTFPIVPAQNVPEELIEEAQAVLQGKSRNTIIRELQRTNLDINVAVNNLLGRDEDMDEGQDDDQYAQDFVSFMDVPGIEAAGSELHPSVLLEATEGNSDDSACLALRCASLSRRVASVRGEIERERRNTQGWPIGHISQEQLFGGEEPRKFVPKNETKIIRPCPLKFSQEIEWCRYEKINTLAHFSMIVALHSELLLVGAETDCLVQWRFDKLYAYTDAKNPDIHHPRTVALGLLNERIASLDACVSRASVCTKETSKICSFVDESLGALASSKLDCPAVYFSSNAPLKVYTSCYFSAVFCESDRVFWWGALPKKSRMKLMDRAKDKSKRQSGCNEEQELAVNSEVLLHAVRFIQVGAVGYIVKEGIPKIGQLLDSVISTDSTYRFLVRNDIRVSEDILDISELTRYDERHDQAPTGSKRKRCSVEENNFCLEFTKNFRSDLNCNEWYEENWHIGDVVFIEESKISPLGTVLVIDKSHVLIKLALEPSDINASNTVLSNTRIFRKDDLRIYDREHTSFLPDFFVKFPKRVAVDLGQPLAMAVDNEVLHCISVNMNCTAYLSIDMPSSKIVKFYDFPFKIYQNPSEYSCAINLHVPFTNCPLLMRDANQCPIQLKKTPSNTLQEVEWNNILPFTSFTNIVVPLKTGDRFSASGYRLISFATAKHSRLIPLILRAQVEKVFALIYPEDGDDSAMTNSVTAQELASERCDGNHNIIHVVISLCAPKINKPIKEAFTKRKDDKGYTKNRIWTGNETTDNPVTSSSMDDDELIDLWTPISVDLAELESRGCVILKFLLQGEFFADELITLLSSRNHDGHTPFMYAVANRAYSAAIDIFDKIMDLTDSQANKAELIKQFIFPTNSNLDDCPLYMISCNDTCSYTWTGDEHINQNVFKCYTCNLQGSRCCCTECARLCHKNHDCRLKNTSPTAYCDCWEVCKCKALIAGDQKARVELFTKLLKETDLISSRNSQGEPLPLFLAQTAARQLMEQRQYKGNNRTLLRLRRSVAGVNSSGPTVSSIPGSLFTYAQMFRRNRQRNGTPDHDLAPPTFCVEVLDQILSDHNALNSVLHVTDSSITDRFVLTLMTRLPEAMINQLIIQMDSKFECFLIPFLESVARVVVYLSMITSVDARCNLQVGILANANTKGTTEPRTKPKPLAPLLEKAREIFSMYPMKSMEALLDLSEILIAPVKSGAVGPESNILLYNDVKLAIQALEETSTSTLDRHGRPNIFARFNTMLRTNNIDTNLAEQDSSDHSDDDRSTISFHADDDDDRGAMIVESYGSSNDQTHASVSADEEDETVVVGEHDTDDDEDDDDEDDDVADDAGEDGHQVDDDEDEIGADSLASSDEDEESQERPNVVDEVFEPQNEDNLTETTNHPTESDMQQTVTPNENNSGVTFSSLVSDNREGVERVAVDQGQTVPFTADLIDARCALSRGYACALRLVAFIVSHINIDEKVEDFLALRLAHTWSWLCTLMNSTELSLRHGTWLTSLRSRKPTFVHPLHSSFLKIVIDEAKRFKQQLSEATPLSVDNFHSSRQFLMNVQSLWKTNSIYHQHSLPYLNMMACKHFAYVADCMLALLLTMDKSGKPLPFTLPWNTNNLTVSSDKRDVFFHRTESTLCIGMDAPDVFSTPVAEAIPLVMRSQLLQPDAYREEMWYTGEQTNAEEMLNWIVQPNECTRSTHHRIFNNQFDRMPLGDQSFLLKWRLTLEVFSRLFIDDVGSEICSILPCFANFHYTETKFRQEAERLRNTATKEIRFENVERSRISLIYKLFRSLNVTYIKATATTSVPNSFPLLAFSKVRVSFKDEPGEGVGVTRSFYTAVIHELLSEESLPPLDSCQATLSHGRFKERRLSVSPLVTNRSTARQRSEENTRTRRSLPSLIDETHTSWTSRYQSQQELNQPSNLQENSQSTENLNQPSTEFSRMLSFNPTSDEELRSRVTEAIGLLFSSSTGGRSHNDKYSKTTDDDFKDDNSLFWKPQIDKEFYAPRPNKITNNRLNAFRNVGRLIGLCLLNNDILPLFLCRHVIKFIIGREISWHDLAFFDPTIYESFRQLLLEVESDPGKDMSEIGLRWTVDMRSEEGNGTTELVENGLNTPVTSENLANYVKAYTQHRLCKIVEPFLKSLRMGILDVLPATILKNLTAEEFRLLLNGSDRIDVKSLYTYTTFNDESGDETPDRLDRFKRWFWTVIEGMSPQKRQDLVLFWTGSPTLPSSAEGFQASPSITIRHPDDQHLPTANTCISRLYIPLYSSKRILRHKLLYAIKAKNFGFI